MTAVAGSGMRIMSLSLIAFQPAMELPSNMMPSRNASSSMVETCCAVCCHLPRGSVNRRSTYSTAFSRIISMTWAMLPGAGPLPVPVSGELGSIAILVLYPSVCRPPDAALQSFV